MARAGKSGGPRGSITVHPAPGWAAPPHLGDTMRKFLTALVATGSISAAAIATSSNAEAGWGWGPGAVVGGVIAGAVVGSAIASRPYYYPYGYYGYGPNPYYGPPCGRVWNGYVWVPAC